jgi:hypothetical protein
MNREEVQVLSIIDGSHVHDFLEKAAEILNMGRDIISNIVESLKKEEYVATMQIVNNEIYTYTKRVKKEMLDPDLYRQYGSKPLYIFR